MVAQNFKVSRFAFLVVVYLSGIFYYLRFLHKKSFLFVFLLHFLYLLLNLWKGEKSHLMTYQEFHPLCAQMNRWIRKQSNKPQTNKIKNEIKHMFSQCGKWNVFVANPSAAHRNPWNLFLWHIWAQIASTEKNHHICFQPIFTSRATKSLSIKKQHSVPKGQSIFVNMFTLVANTLKIWCENEAYILGEIVIKSLT